MTGLVLELQADAMDVRVGVADLLRKALAVSRKLGVSDIQKWINNELHGYGDSDPPEYRQFTTQLKVHNPYRGWQPLFVGDAEFARALASVHVFQPIGEIEELVRGHADGKLIVYPFSPDQEQMLMRAMDVGLRPSRHISSNQLHGIFEAVRNRVLEWALELEGKGVIGEGMTFTKQEKVAASQVTNNYNTNIGSMTHSQWQQGSPHAQQTLSSDANLSIFQAALDRLAEASLSDLNPRTAEELQAEIDSISAQLRSPKPKVSILSESFKSIRAILEQAAGSVVATKAFPAVASALEYLKNHL